MRRVTYTDTSPCRLSDAELAYLVETHGEDVFRNPVFVDDGYDIGTGWSNGSDWGMRVGRSGLYERMAVERLTSGQRDRRLRGLFYPGADSVTVHAVSSALLR